MNRPLYISCIKILLFLPLDLTLLQAATGISSFSHSLNGVCWFLSCLFCIYLISPLIMKFLKQHIKSNKMAIIGIGLSLVSSCVFASVFQWVDESTFFNDLCYGSPYRRVIYVIYGMIVAQIYVFNKENKSLGIIKSCIFEYLSILCAICWFFLRNMSIEILGVYIYSIDMVIVGGLLFAFALEMGYFSKIFSSSLMVYWGNISMYIFISHYNIRMYLDYVVRVLNVKSMTVAIVEVTIILVLTFLISICIHQYRTKKLSKISMVYEYEK